MTIIKTLLFILCLCSVAHAEVITDGSLGARVELSGKNYQITPELGQQLGGNLFHSFQSFNLNADESATFSGAPSVQNVIARVTGGTPSQIDGLIRSTIPNADLYLINPYGVMFGQNAKLDLQGGFHVSTADYLKLQDGGRFDARTPNNSLLSVAPVTAFGFLTDSPAAITTQDSMLITPPGKPLSLIGGNLSLTGHLPLQFEDNNSHATFASSLLHTTGSQINLVAIGSAGEVVMNDELTMTGRGGNITLNRTLIDTSGLGSGNLLVRGGQLEMHDSTLQANSFGEAIAGVIDVQLTDSWLTDSSSYYFNTVSSNSFIEQGQGQSGSLNIKVPLLTANRAFFLITSYGLLSGNINIAVKQLKLLEGAGITTGSGSLAKSGDLTINASESILLSGHSIGKHLVGAVMLTDMSSFIDTSNYTYTFEGNSLGGGAIRLTTPQLDLVGGFITSSSFGTGNAGDIIIQADNVNLVQGGTISTVSQRTGQAGNIQLDVKDTLFLSGRLDHTLVTPVTGIVFENNQSNITSFSLLGSGGQIDLSAKAIHLTKDAVISASSMGLSDKTSSINLQAETISLTESAQINSSNHFYAGNTVVSGTNQGQGGDINIQTKQLTLDGKNQKPSLQQITSISSDTYTSGVGGNIAIQAESLDISNGAAISARSFNTGAAGQLALQTNHLSLQQGGSISTSTLQSGGGNILLHLNHSAGQIDINNSEIATSVATGQGNGGNITIEQPQFITINHGQIKAQADAGHGGNISVSAQHFIPSSDSLISASSNLGIDGSIVISSPTEDVGNQVLNLSSNFTNAADLLPRSCAARIADQRPSQFTRPFTLVITPHFRNDDPEDARPSHSLQPNIERFSQK